MTVLEASGKLFAWFAEHDSFCVNIDEKKLLSDRKRKKFERKEELAAIQCALLELKDMEMLASHTIEGEEVWVLNRGFETISQKIELHADTCMSISLIVNGFCEMVGNSADKPDPKNIREQDVKNLLFVCSHLMDNASSKAESPTDTDDLSE